MWDLRDLRLDRMLARSGVPSLTSLLGSTHEAQPSPHHAALQHHATCDRRAIARFHSLEPSPRPANLNRYTFARSPTSRIVRAWACRGPADNRAWPSLA